MITIIVCPRRAVSASTAHRERRVGAKSSTQRAATGRSGRPRHPTNGVSTAAVRSWSRCTWWPAWASRSVTGVSRTRTWAPCAAACRTPRSGCTCACARVCWPPVVAPAWPPADGFSSTPSLIFADYYCRCPCDNPKQNGSKYDCMHFTMVVFAGVVQPSRKFFF